MRIIFLFLLAISQITVMAQSNLTPFSELSGVPDILFQSIQIPDGYIYAVPARDPVYRFRFFKINENGKITDSLVLGNDTIRYSGYLERQDGKNYFVATGYPAPFDNYLLASSKIQREIFEISNDLKIVSQKKIGKLPNKYATSSSITTLGIKVHKSDAIFVQKDTLFLLQYYFIMDSIGSFPQSKGVRYEQIGIGAEKFWNVKELNAVQGFLYNSFITNDFIYTFGELNTQMFPSNIPYNAGLMGKFDRAGKLLLPAEIDKEGSGTLGDGLTGVSHSDKIYCAYSGRFKNNVCDDRIATIDIRDSNFKMIKRATVSHCKVIPSGSNPFAFATNGDIYFQGSLGAQVGIYKYNSNLDLLWGKLYDLPSHAPISLKVTKDSGLLVECSERVPSTSNTYIKLYKLNSDGDITAITTLSTVNTPKNLFYPNPFQSQLSLQESIEGASEVQLSDINGRIVGIFLLNKNSIEVSSDLPKGVYIAQIKDEKGKILGQQMIVKQ